MSQPFGYQYVSFHSNSTCFLKKTKFTSTVLVLLTFSCVVQLFEAVGHMKKQILEWEQNNGPIVDEANRLVESTQAIFQHIGIGIHDTTTIQVKSQLSSWEQCIFWKLTWKKKKKLVNTTQQLLRKRRRTPQPRSSSSRRRESRGCQRCTNVTTASCSRIAADVDQPTGKKRTSLLSRRWMTRGWTTGEQWIDYFLFIYLFFWIRTVASAMLVGWASLDAKRSPGALQQWPSLF